MATTKLLQQAIFKLKKLPSHQQDAIASRFLAELDDEKAWTNSFTATTDEQWDNLAALVRQDIASGKTQPLDDLLLNTSTHK